MSGEEEVEWLLASQSLLLTTTSPSSLDLIQLNNYHPQIGQNNHEEEVTPPSSPPMLFLSKYDLEERMKDSDLNNEPTINEEDLEESTTIPQEDQGTILGGSNSSSPLLPPSPTFDS